jgi:hypothetical protein
MSRWACGLSILLSLTAAAPAADVPEALIGKWVSQDADKKPIVFDKDGTCQYGWDKKDGDWVMVSGTFKMEAADRARARFEHGGVVLSLWWRLKDGHLESPKNGPPLVWKKEEKKDEKK